MQKLYFEDFAVGQVYDLGTYHVTEEEILNFARHYDPQPFHIDREAAQGSHFGDLISSGWMTCSIMMRLVVLNLLQNSSSMGSPGLDGVRWIKPVYAGDTLTVTFNVVDVIPSRSKPDRGVIKMRWEAFNQDKELVCTVEGMGMFGCRPAG